MIEKIYFETEDEVELVGLLHKPKNKTNEIVISVHGMQSNCFKKREDIFSSLFSSLLTLNQIRPAIKLTDIARIRIKILLCFT